MWGRWGTRLAIALLKHSAISNADRQLLTTAMLDKLGALPLRARIIQDDAGKIFVDGKQVNLESAKRLHENSKTMLTNFARRFIREQVTWMAVQKGVHENTSPEEGLFAKAALWCLQEEDKLYREFAQLDVEEQEE